MEPKDEIIIARKQSAKLRGEIRKLNTLLEAEIENHEKTLRELKELKSLHGKGKKAKEEEITPDGLQKKETREEVDQRRLRKMPGRTCFVQLLPHCRPKQQKRIFLYDLEKKKGLIYTNICIFFSSWERGGNGCDLSDQSPYIIVAAM